MIAPLRFGTVFRLNGPETLTRSLADDAAAGIRAKGTGASVTTHNQGVVLQTGFDRPNYVELNAVSKSIGALIPMPYRVAVKEQLIAQWFGDTPKDIITLDIPDISKG